MKTLTESIRGISIDGELNKLFFDENLSENQKNEILERYKETPNFLEEKKLSYLDLVKIYYHLKNKYSSYILKNNETEEEPFKHDHIKKIFHYFFVLRYIDDFKRIYKNCSSNEQINLKDFVAKYKGMDFKRGLCVVGGTGVGKTTIMKFMLKECFNKSDYLDKSTSVCLSYSATEIAGIYKKPDGKDEEIEIKKIKSKDCFLDDFGIEKTSVRDYGDEMHSPLFYFIHDRYSLWQDSENKIKTHITTNLNAKEIKEKYAKFDAHGRTFDRLKDMFNIIVVDNKIKSFRKENII